MLQVNFLILLNNLCNETTLKFFFGFRLNSVVVYEKISATEFNPTHLSELVGPFFSLNYNPETQHILASCRPSEESSKVRHVYCELTGTTCQKIHTFFGGSSQTFLSRSSFIEVNNGTLVAAFQENTNSVILKIFLLINRKRRILFESINHLFCRLNYGVLPQVPKYKAFLSVIKS